MRQAICHEFPARFSEEEQRDLGRAVNGFRRLALDIQEIWATQS